MPAGQPEDSAPSRSAAGKSATSEIPAHLEALTTFALLIVTGTAKTKGLVRAANRAGCRQAAPIFWAFQRFTSYKFGFDNSMFRPTLIALSAHAG